MDVFELTPQGARYLNDFLAPRGGCAPWVKPEARQRWNSRAAASPSPRS